MHLAIKTFLMVVDMTDDEDAPTASYQTDITLRAWYGVKLVRHVLEIRDGKLISSPELTSSGTRDAIAVPDGSPSQR